MNTGLTEQEVELATKQLAQAFWRIVNQSLPSLAWQQVAPAFLESVLEAQKALILRLADQPAMTAADETAIERVWAICPRDAPREDAMNHGPTPDRQSMLDLMEDGDVLVGFDAENPDRPQIRFVMVSGALVAQPRSRPDVPEPVQPATSDAPPLTAAFPQTSPQLSGWSHHTAPPPPPRRPKP